MNWALACTVVNVALLGPLRIKERDPVRQANTDQCYYFHTPRCTARAGAQGTLWP